MRVIITRVQPQAQHWVDGLQRAGHHAIALPLIETRALPDCTALVNAWQRLADYAAVMFVSGPAVAYFYASKQPLGLMDNALTAPVKRAWATGPGTRNALLAQGVPAELIDSPAALAGQYDSEALWQQVQQQLLPGQRVLIVRGDSRSDDGPMAAPDSAAGIAGVGRDWLARHLQLAGILVDFVVAYRRGAPVWSAEGALLASAAATDGSIWVFSSAEAVANLQTLLPKQSWAKARAVATHQRIAAAVRTLGFAVVLLASPTLPSVLASIESCP